MHMFLLCAGLGGLGQPKFLRQRMQANTIPKTEVGSIILQAMALLVLKSDARRGCNQVWRMSIFFASTCYVALLVFLLFSCFFFFCFKDFLQDDMNLLNCGEK